MVFNFSNFFHHQYKCYLQITILLQSLKSGGSLGQLSSVISIFYSSDYRKPLIISHFVVTLFQIRCHGSVCNFVIELFNVTLPSDTGQQFVHHDHSFRIKLYLRVTFAFYLSAYFFSLPCFLVIEYFVGD